ncbi:hypothetical protein M422DRAFT_34126, partial [Sphaerobolus stellatus SS14]
MWYQEAEISVVYRGLIFVLIQIPSLEYLAISLERFTHIIIEPVQQLTKYPNTERRSRRLTLKLGRNKNLWRNGIKD